MAKLTDRKLIDVFIAATALDRPLALSVSRFLQGEGFGTSSASAIDTPAGNRMGDAIRAALAEASAVVVLVTSSSVGNINLGLEVGLALGWSKPVFLVVEDQLTRVPHFLAGFRQVPVSRIHLLVEWLKNLEKPLQAKEVDVLRDAYLAIGVHMDQYLGRPDLLDQLGRQVSKRIKREIAPERLLQEMLRLRKQGKWPRLNPRKATASRQRSILRRKTA